MSLPMRARYRQGVLEEIKRLAAEQVATDGAAGLSLNAIAKEMGMSGPALYRYYDGRDELLTELIVDAYDELAASLEEAADGPGPVLERMRSVGDAYRRWAQANPSRYDLILGTPVPGYTAPAERTTPPAHRPLVLTIGLLNELVGGRSLTAEPDEQLSRWAEARGHGDTAPVVLQLALMIWSHLHGFVSLEIRGHLEAIAPNADVLFRREVDLTMREVEAALTGRARKGARRN